MFKWREKKLINEKNTGWLKQCEKLLKGSKKNGQIGGTKYKKVHEKQDKV